MGSVMICLVVHADDGVRKRFRTDVGFRACAWLWIELTQPWIARCGYCLFSGERDESTCCTIPPWLQNHVKREHVYDDDAKIAPPSLKRASILVPYLPLDITINILAKLSTKSLLSCKRVCKEWDDIIEDPFFAQLHYDNIHIALIGIPLPLGNKSMMMIESCYGVKGYKVETLEMSIWFGTDFNIVNSCRGFLLIKNQRSEKPSQGKLVCGLAFSGNTKQYKVVTFSKQDGIYLKQVLTIGTWEWRRIHGGESILDKIPPENNNPLALNDSIHWLATGEKIALAYCMDVCASI
ncbi:putative F-box protein At3g28280 [Silene latifolia]|uniref:putative F-box protein At3g28280 n=1 Tax=Silene latifolia TaxID=37657 RepID=UPI003D77EF8C